MGEGAQLNVRDVVNAVGSAALAARFEDEAPEYPGFPVYWTSKSRPQAAQDALRWIAGPRRSSCWRASSTRATWCLRFPGGSSPGTLKHFRHDRPQVEAQRAGLDALREVEAFHTLVGNLANAASYFPAAEAALPADHEWIPRQKAVREDLLAQIVDPAARSAAGFRRHAQRKLADLKRAYIETYLALHARARLDVEEDRRKSRLLADGRLRQLEALANIDLLPRRQLDDFLERVTALKSCPALTAHDLGAGAECPHCAFRPSAERAHATVGARLAALDGELDTLLSTWTGVLLSNLDDPATRAKLDLLRPDQRAPVQAFLASRLLPDPPDRDFIDAVAQVLSGLAKVVVTVDDLRAALFPAGSPATPGKLKQRFADYLDERAKGRDEAQVRIVIE